MDGLQEGDILRYDGIYWVNTVPEDSMTNDDVLAVVSEVGYLTELAITDIPGGLYPQITGIGDYIEVGSMVELGKDTYISGDLYMGGTVGTLLFPIETKTPKKMFRGSKSTKTMILKTCIFQACSETWCRRETCANPN